MDTHSPQEELKTAYALAVELCCANFKLVPPENDFIGMLEEVWEINKTITFFII